MRFFHLALRTLGVAEARAFYAAVLGSDDAEIFQLHEQAVARGARPHWLGFLGVGDVDAATATFQARGATPLGPKWVNPRGLEAAVIRDPGGALVALAKPPPAEGTSSVVRPDVLWHQLNTADVERAKANYGALLGWEFKEPVHLGALGVAHPFAWQPGGATVGALSDVAGRPSVHPHWLFHFRVNELEPTLEKVRAQGGLVAEPVTLPNGVRVAACDDPQGAAFALFQPAGD